MARTKGAIGQKKRTLLQIIEAKARQRGKYMHPVVWLAEVYRTGRIYDNEEKEWIEVDAAQRIDAAKTVAQYVAPRIKPADLENMTEKTSQFMVRWEGIDQEQDQQETLKKPIQENKSIASDNSAENRTDPENPKPTLRDRFREDSISMEKTNNNDGKPKRRRYRVVDSPVTLPR